MSAYLPAKVNVQLAVDKEVVKENIRENLKVIPSWYSKLFYPNGFEAIIISAGPSMEKYVREINLKERMEHPGRSFVVFCVKHALPRLIDMGVIPDYCVLLDGRPFEGNSTHGIKRSELFTIIPDKTIFFVASMSHPGYAKHLLNNGARVLGWHTQVTGIDEFPIKEPIINGGTSSGTRCIALAHAMGIRSITLLGFDSCVHNVTEADLNLKDEKGRPRYLPVDMPCKPTFTEEQTNLLGTLTESYAQEGLIYGSTIAKRFYTTGELLAQTQDFESIFKAPSFDIQFTVLDDGLVNHMFHNMQGRQKRSFSFLEYFKEACPLKGEKPLRKKMLSKPKKVPLETVPKDVIMSNG